MGRVNLKHTPSLICRQFLRASVMRMRQLARASGIAESNGKHAERFRVSAWLDAELEFGVEL